MAIRISKYLYLLLVMILFLSCIKSKEEISFKINVEDSKTNQPLVDASIYFDRKFIGKTNTSGELAKDYLPPEDYVSVICYKRGYLIKREVIMDINKHNDIGLTIEPLENVLEINAKTKAVEYVEAQPIANATIKMDGTRIGETDSLGVLKKHIPPTQNTLTITIEKAGTKFIQTRETIKFVENKREYPILFEASLPPPRHFTIYIEDEFGSPAPNVKITCSGPENIPHSDNDGNSEVTIYRAVGTEKFEFYKDQYFLEKITKKIERGKKDYTLDVKTPSLRKFEVKVTCEGKPLPSATVRIEGKKLVEIDNAGNLRAVTNRKGEINGYLALFNKRSYSAKASKQEFEYYPKKSSMKRKTDNTFAFNLAMRKVYLLNIETVTRGTQQARADVNVTFTPKGDNPVSGITNTKGLKIFKYYKTMQGKVAIYDPLSQARLSKDVNLDNYLNRVRFYLPLANTNLYLTVISEDTKLPIEAAIYELNNRKWNKIGDNPIHSFPTKSGRKSFKIVPNIGKYGTRYVSNKTVTLELTTGKFERSVIIELNRKYFIQKYLNDRKYNDALKIASKVTDEDYPDYLYYRYQSGYINEKLGKNEDAKKCYNEVIKKDRNYAPAYYRLGYLFYSDAKKINSTEPYRIAIIHFKNVLTYERYLSQSSASETVFKVRYFIAMSYQKIYEKEKSEQNRSRAQTNWQEFFDLIPRDISPQEFGEYIKRAKNYCPDCRNIPAGF